MSIPGIPNGGVSPRAVPWYERHWGWLACGIVLVPVVVALLLASSDLPRGPDPVKYADLARSLARGDGYLFNGGREAKHSPGFPVLLAPLFRMTANPFLPVRVMLALTFGTALYLAGMILRRELGAGVSLTALACVAASVPLWWSTQFILSEYPYTLFQNLALILLVRLTASERPRKRSALLFGLVTGAAILTRSAGMTLIATCAYVLLRHRLAGKLTTARAAVLGALALGVPAVAFGAWRAYTTLYVGAAMPENINILMRGYGTVAGSSRGSIIVQTVKNLLSRGGGLIFGEIAPSQYPSVETLVWGALLLVWIIVPLALVVRGLWRAEPIWVFLCVYLSVIALWPLARGATARLCWPVAPFLVAALLSSYRWLAGKIWHRRGPLVASAAIGAAVFIGQVTLGSRLWASIRSDQAFWTTRLADIVRIRDRFHPAPPAVWAHLNVRETVYVFDMPTTVMEFTWPKNPERWAEALDEYRPDYVVVPTTPGQTENAELFVETLRQVRPATACVAELQTVSVYHIPRASPAQP